MNHYSEDELILFYYEEGRRPQAVQQHLDECPSCATLYGSIARTLKMVAAPAIPERDERYGLEVWQRLRPVLPVEPPPGRLFWNAWMQLATGGAIAAVVVAAFFIGQTWSRPPAERPSAALSAPSAAVVSLDPTDRIRMAAISDHIEESERLLVDFVNAGGQVVDITDQQELASQLVDANRYFREASAGAGDTVVADVLDSLERSLMEIAHGPARLTPDEFKQTRTRLDAAGLLFKLRVLADELRDREASPTSATQNPKTT